ncbi:hypothetical protein MMCCUG48898_4175 [Mycobacteroides abscessus subsp. massiliense CCUG 48898 = JCM 15300]|nr:hypothetical protein MMCCUG48898_4175 [Mycobacteroides abscessus subsp. massiliense CCUG 48898 = JCM 15300]
MSNMRAAEPPVTFVIAGIGSRLPLARELCCRCVCRCA